MPTRNQPLTTEEAVRFVKLWENPEWTVKDIAEEFGRTPIYCTTLARNLRKRGVPIEKRTNRTPRYDTKAIIAGLNAKTK